MGELRVTSEGMLPAGSLARSGRNFGYLVGSFILSLFGFLITAPVFLLGVATFWTVIGLFVLLGALIVAGGFARFQRSLLASAGVHLISPIYPHGGTGLRSRLRRLGHAQSWRDLLHILITFLISLVTFPMAMIWVAGGVGGVTYWFWSRWLPEHRQGLAWLMGYHGELADIIVNAILGMLLLVTAPFVLRGLMLLHAGIARGLLVDENSALRQQLSELAISRAAAGDAELHTLRRLERDLHDGPQQRLVRLGMDITAAQRRVDTNPAEAKSMLAQALKHSQDALAEIRSLSRGIAPPILSEQGLRAAITALVARGHASTTVDIPDIDLSDAAQNAAYFVIAESLANMEKHSGAEHCDVEVHKLGSRAVISITDDGIGGASIAKGHGLAGLSDRLAGVDGTLTISSPAGGPTQIIATIPVLPPGS
ncbi:sensor histidine kinase [Microlunatus panaciterrae]|uniref:histidine kinase n=1 Tax=Microlunatus panaciterrae TaxID=400768 RepID=A0ABS2RKZ3_9ACTN|nr:sensor histidine kinase [Microlunatus panaciterrae]MBM7798589.1 signal transduction histidine kinase [Microlunatus panaciterrae]